MNEKPPMQRCTKCNVFVFDVEDGVCKPCREIVGYQNALGATQKLLDQATAELTTLRASLAAARAGLQEIQDISGNDSIEMMIRVKTITRKALNAAAITAAMK